MIEKKYSQADIYKRGKLHFFIGLTVSLLLIIGAFEWKTYEDGSVVDFQTQSDDIEEILEIPITEQPPPPPPKLQQPEIVEVEDEKEIIEEIEIDFDIEITEETIVEEIEPFEFEEPTEEVPDEIFLIVEDKPEFEGGMSAFYQYVSDEINYPKHASRMDIEGKVFVEFVINKDGSLTDVKTVKGIGGGCDEEAERVLKNCPKWKPGKQRGVPVRVKMIIPITFQLK